MGYCAAALIVLSVLFLLFVAVRLSIPSRQERAPLILDLSDPADEYEYRCWQEQNKYGRERYPVKTVNEEKG